jgi:hypothetical protein
VQPNKQTEMIGDVLLCAGQRNFTMRDRAIQSADRNLRGRDITMREIFARRPASVVRP